MDAISTGSFGKSEPWKNRAYFFICIIDITGGEVMHNWFKITNCSHFTGMRGNTFISLSSLNQILSAEFYKKFRNFLEVKLTIMRLI